MICLRVTQAGGGARSTTALYHPLFRCQASRWSGGSDPISVSTYAPTSSALCFLSSCNFAFMARPNLQINVSYYAIYRHAEKLLSTSLHVTADIHMFFLAPWDCGFGTALSRAAKIPSSLVGEVGGWRDSQLRPSRYLAWSLRGALCRQPRTM